MTQKQNSGDQRPRFDQSKTKTATEFFHEKFADADEGENEEDTIAFIDPKGETDVPRGDE